MGYAFLQGYLDSLCGVYCIVNAEKVINKSSDDQSQRIFNLIVRYLSRNGDLDKAIIKGISYTQILRIINDILSKRISVFDSRKSFSDLDDWWNYSETFINYTTNGSIILSLGGREDHYTAIKSMTDGMITLSDSGGIRTIRKTSCVLKGNDDSDKYIIYPYQCIYLTKES